MRIWVSWTGIVEENVETHVVQTGGDGRKVGVLTTEARENSEVKVAVVM